MRRCRQQTKKKKVVLYFLGAKSSQRLECIESCVLLVNGDYMLKSPPPHPPRMSPLPMLPMPASCPFRAKMRW